MIYRNNTIIFVFPFIFGKVVTILCVLALKSEFLVVTPYNDTLTCFSILYIMYFVEEAFYNVINTISRPAFTI